MQVIERHCRLFPMHSNIAAQEHNQSIQYEITPLFVGGQYQRHEGCWRWWSAIAWFRLQYFLPGQPGWYRVGNIYSTRPAMRISIWLFICYLRRHTFGRDPFAGQAQAGRAYAWICRDLQASIYWWLAGRRWNSSARFRCRVVILGSYTTSLVTWLDPFIALIYSTSLSNKLSLSLRGDVGGFGIESELAVNAEAILHYQFGKTFSCKFGYRYLRVDFEDNSLVYEVSLDGLLFGLGIRF